MTRQYLIDYLDSEGCCPVEGSETIAGELWRNCINGEFCNVPFDDPLEMTTYCHILYELKVAPPVDADYDSNYYVYVGWREHQLKLQNGGD